MRTSDRLVLAGLLVVAVVPYLNALGNGFVFDDRGVIVENPLVQRDSTLLADFFTNPYYPGALYRPLTFWSFSLNQRLDPAPFGFHLVNLLLHGLVTALVFVYCRTIRLSTPLAALAGLIFAVHPIHTEAVTSIVGRAELLSAAAVLGALLCGVRSIEGRRFAGLWLIAATLLFAIGLLCKESAFVFLPLFALTVWLRAPVPWRELVRTLWASRELTLLSAVGAVYLCLRWVLFGTLAVGDPVSLLDNPLAYAPATVRIATALVILVDSLVQLVVPLQLSADYSYNQIPLVTSFDDPRLLLAAALLLLLGVAAWRTRKAEPAVLGSALFFLAALSLTSNLLFPIGTIRGERLLYLPSAGFCILFALAVAAGLERRAGLVIAGVALLALVFAGRTWQRNYDWASELTIFEASTASSPNSAKAYHNLGVALAQAKRGDEAIIAFRRALRIYPDYDEAAFALGCDYQARGMMTAALHWYREALRIEPKHVKSHLNTGIIHYNDGDLGEAEEAFRAGLAISPSDPRLLKGIGFVRLAEGRSEEARAVLERAQRLAPGDVETRSALELAMNPSAGRLHAPIEEQP